MTSRRNSCCAAVASALALSLILCSSSIAAAGSAFNAPHASSPFNSFSEHFVASWAPNNVRFLGSAQGESGLQLSLDEATGAGFASKQSYLFGNFDMQIKLVPGDSAGTVTAYYLSSDGMKHDELDFEFLGNVSGQPYVLQTNVFSAGVGGREQRINLWFDPTLSFHTYSVAWSIKRVVFFVDSVPIRVFSNNEKTAGVPYLSKQPMRVYSSIWNGDTWATEGGLVKINWQHAPFVATYQGFRARKTCAASTSAEEAACVRSAAAATNQVNNAGGAAAASHGYNHAKLRWVKRNFMVYNYCTDTARYPIAPAECSREF